KMATGRLLDDLAPFDRAFRLIAARRNVYVWILACGFLLDALPQSYAIICGWAAFSAAVHLVRSIWICDGAVRRFVGIRSLGTTKQRYSRKIRGRFYRGASCDDKRIRSPRQLAREASRWEISLDNARDLSWMRQPASD